MLIYEQEKAKLYQLIKEKRNDEIWKYYHKS